MLGEPRNGRTAGYIILLIGAAAAVSVLAGTAVPADDPCADGISECGDRLVWAYDEDSRTLTVSGPGPMFDYALGNAPWYRYFDDISCVVLAEGITHIGSSAFYGCSSLGSVEIPDSVETIGDNAFLWCTSLTAVRIPDSVKTIGAGAFQGCISLVSAEISGSVTAISECAFQGCSALTSVTIPDSVTEIGEAAFGWCYSLASAEISGSVTVIGESAFCCCDSLTEAFIPGSVKTIGNYAFFGCSSLYSAYISDRVMWIGVSAFSGCVALSFVSIPASVISIGFDAFALCPDVTVYSRSIMALYPGEYGLSQTAKVVNRCPKTVDVTFMDGDSELCTVAETLCRHYILPDPEPKEGLSFLGWFDDRGTEITSDTLVTLEDAAVLHAEWSSAVPGTADGT